MKQGKERQLRTVKGMRGVNKLAECMIVCEGNCIVKVCKKDDPNGHNKTPQDVHDV